MRAARILAATTAALFLALAASAPAELTQHGSVIVAFDSDLAPRSLPRQEPAPISISVAGKIKSSKKGKPIPQLRTIAVAINQAGRLYDHGLPICHVEAIQPATEASARRICGGSIVGNGHVTVIAHVPTQTPFAVDASLLAFNGPVVHGHKEILAQVYAKDPPGAFVLTFKLKRHAGLFGTVMSTHLPSSAQGWAYLSSFEMTLHRTYRRHGKQRSFLSAACAVPPGFPGATFPFAKATYGFADGQKLKTTVVRSCDVK